MKRLNKEQLWDTGIPAAFSPRSECRDMSAEPLKTLEELGQIMIDAVGKEACTHGYRIPGDDLAEIGRQALMYRDINRDGTLN